MEKVYDLDGKPWISKRKLNLKHQLEFRTKQLEHNGVYSEICDNDYNEDEKSLASELETFAKTNYKDIKDHFLFNTTDEKTLVVNPSCQLKMYKSQLKHAKQMISDQAYKVNYLIQLKTTRNELLMRHLAMMNRLLVDNSGSDQIPPLPSASDRSTLAIVVVQVWRQPARRSKIRLEKEILFRSDQYLHELRDQIKCQRDYGVPMDLSDNPEQADRVYRGELFRSSYFLVNDTFYNDLRDPNSTDLSAGVMEWASKEISTINEFGENVKISRGIGPFKSCRMEDCKFEDLQFRLGCPYLYLHQGNCEHLFTISDIRYVANNLKLNRTVFPFSTAASVGSKMDHIRCYMCKSRPPHWYTRNNARLPVDPFFFCECCFDSFNYDGNKRKIGQFQAYLYTGTFGIPDNVIIHNDK